MNHGLEDTDLGPHLRRLRDLVMDLDAEQVIELGVRGGASTRAILSALEVTDGRLWSCDVSPHGAGPECADNPRWTFHQGDDIGAAPAAPRWCDLLFIDTSHEHDHTEAELATYGPRVRPGGVIAMHDADPIITSEGIEQDVIRPAARFAAKYEREIHYWPTFHGFLVIR